ncbi:hypothetical protein EDC01DRAFT_626261 [Geopyxis carbonaria]|nr:hypothetical protein EDC01DRAFT_626261 [Geopyxis carbonaria]
MDLSMGHGLGWKDTDLTCSFSPGTVALVHVTSLTRLKSEDGARKRWIHRAKAVRYKTQVLGLLYQHSLHLFNAVRRSRTIEAHRKASHSARNPPAFLSVVRSPSFASNQPLPHSICPSSTKKRPPRSAPAGTKHRPAHDVTHSPTVTTAIATAVMAPINPHSHAVPYYAPLVLHYDMPPPPPRRPITDDLIDPLLLPPPTLPPLYPPPPPPPPQTQTQTQAPRYQYVRQPATSGTSFQYGQYGGPGPGPTSAPPPPEWPPVGRFYHAHATSAVAHSQSYSHPYSQPAPPTTDMAQPTTPTVDDRVCTRCHKAGKGFANATAKRCGPCQAYTKEYMERWMGDPMRGRKKRAGGGGGGGSGGGSGGGGGGRKRGRPRKERGV